MPDSFLILLAGGIMLAAAVSDPRAVTLNWLRLAGILALSIAGLAAFFFVRREESKVTAQWATIGLTMAAVLGQLAFVQVASRGIQRALAVVAFLGAVIVGTVLFPRNATTGPEPWRLASATATTVGVASATGLALMDILLG